MVIRLVDSSPDQLQQQLEILQTEKHERETLIWKKEMKDHLQQEIWNNSSGFIEDLYSAVTEANTSSSVVQQQHIVPLYSRRVPTCVKYADIENEIRCGQYYLRIWAEQYRDQYDVLDTVNISVE
jgi:hypothetical protein